jgi:hypothetical protein
MLVSMMLSSMIALTSPARAAECPWATNVPLNVTVSKKEVVVNGTSYDIRSTKKLKEFQRTLGACNATEASPYLDNARVVRRRSIGQTIGGGLLIVVGFMLGVGNEDDTQIAYLDGLFTGVGLGALDVARLNAAVARDYRQEAANAIVRSSSAKR